MDLFRKLNREGAASKETPAEEVHNDTVTESTAPARTTAQKLFPVLAAGSGLFAEGYIQSVIGSVGTMLGKIYGKAYTNAPAESNVAAIAFVGIVVGQLTFGYTSDKWSRRNSLVVSTCIMIVFAALSAGAYGAHGTLDGMVSALIAYRFLVGIGIGGEYPAGSVAAAESSGELKAGTRNTWFVMFTNHMIDWGFVIGAFVPYVVVLITSEKHLRAAWRICMGLGVVPPIILLVMRIYMKEPEEYKRESMKNTHIPYKLVIKFYWKRILAVGSIWFLYDFSVYAFGIYSSTIVDAIIGNDTALSTSFGWNTVINLFYIPGAIIGAFFSDWAGARWALIIGVTLQAVVGYIMAGCYSSLATSSHIGGFAAVYGIFLSLGEIGPGDNIGLIASKTSATGIRGQYYGIAAAVGKIGAFVGTKVFPYIEAAGGSSATKSAQYPFWVASSLCILSALIAFFFIPHIGQDTIRNEDIRFREYLESQGWDTRQMGLGGDETIESQDAVLNQSTPAISDEKL